MKLSAGEVTETKTYERVDAGVYPGRCIRIIDLGSYVHPIFKDEKTGEPQTVHEMEIVWELSELMEDGRPFVVSWKKSRPNSLTNKSNLYKLLVAWRGRDFTTDELKCFDLNNILDQCCLVNVAKNATKKDPTKFYNEVISVMPLPKGMTCPERVNELLTFDIPEDLGDEKKLSMLWPMQKKAVENSIEYKRFHTQGQSAPMTKDPSVPF